MKYNRLGATDLTVSRVCFGTWSYGGDWGPVDFDSGKAAVRRALELGVNFFDTAQAYGFGIAEGLLAGALAPELKAKRHELIVATKGGIRKVGPGPEVPDATPAWLRDGITQSLRALGTDYVDVYLLHWPDPKTPFDSVAETLDRFVTEGKARYVGLSNCSVDQLEQFATVRRVDVVQPPLHLFRREAEADILPYCESHDVGVFVYGPLAHGLLTGRITESTIFPPGDWRGESGVFRGNTLCSNLAVVERLRAYASRRGVALPQLAIAWALAHPEVDSAIVGVRDPSQIEQAAPGGEIELCADEIREIERASSGYVEIEE